MPNHTPSPFFLLVTAFLFFPQALLLSSHGASHSPLIQTLPTSGKADEEIHNSKNIWDARRSLAEAPSSQPVESSYVVLVAGRTLRKDPLNGFKKYTGGWNISDRHYWASVGSTALPFFTIATIWFLLFGLCLSLILVFYFCCGRQSYGYSQAAYAISLVVLISCSFAAIIGCVIMYISQEKFHSTTITTLDYVVHQADATVAKLREISSYLAESKQIEVDQVFLRANIQTDIDQIGTRINSSASTLSDKTAENSHNIQDVLDSMRVVLIVIAAVMLSLAFFGFLFSIFGMQILVYILVVIGWILVAGTFILCGSFLVLHNVAADTCIAMDQWVQNPAAHTALDEILPCADSATAQETLLRSKEVTYQLVELMNEVITNISNINFSPDIKAVYYNQSGPLLPILCNRFHSDFTDRACSAGELDMSNAEQVWQNYTCQVSLSEPNICITTGRMTPTLYNQMVTAVNVGNALYNYAPFLFDLEDCTFVRLTFTDIYTNYCPELRAYSRYIYIGLATISFAVMLSVILWLVYGRERRHRVYAKQLLNKSSHERKNY